MLQLLLTGDWRRIQAHRGTTPVDAEPRVLVAEPRPALRQQIGLALRRTGLEVDFAGDVTEALRLTRERQYRVVVVDPEMQGRQGLRLCRELARRHRARGTSVVALSSSGTLLSQLRARLAGACTCLVCPLSLQDFVDTVYHLSEPEDLYLHAFARGI